MKKFRKGLCIALACTAAMSAFSFAGCGEDDGTKTVIRVQNFNGGVGTEWLYAAEKRFEAAYANTSYADGKMGVDVKIDPNMEHNTDSMATSGVNIYIDEWDADIQSLSQQELLLNINDIVEDLPVIFPQVESTLKGNDGNYYALPHYEFYHGISYNIDIFDKYDYYIAAPEESNVEVRNTYGVDVRFTAEDANLKGTNAKRSCGPDGIYNTPTTPSTDDGMPSTLIELMTLCAYMKETITAPFLLSGMYDNYSIYMSTGLWAALSGKEELNSIYSFNGEAELVTGLSQEKLFNVTASGVETDILKPITKKETITNQTGYKVYDTAARYYAISFMEHAIEQGWIHADRADDHTATQDRLIWANSGETPEFGMLLEGSYWYNEANSFNLFSEYEEIYGDVRVGFMPLPSSFDTPVVEGQGSPTTMLESANSHLMINGNIKNNKELVDACKDFVKFLYSDAELKAFTASTGCARPITYNMGESDFNGNEYGYTLWKNRDNGNNVVYFGGENPIFKENKAKFLINLHSSIYIVHNPHMDNKQHKGYYDAIKNGMSSWEIFDDSHLATEQGWADMYSKYFNS